MFKKGVSGNVKGRPIGSGTSGRIREMLSSSEVLEPVLNAIIGKAILGDMLAARLILERICPPLRSQSEVVVLPALSGTLQEQASATLAAISTGELSLESGRQLLGGLADMAKVKKADRQTQKFFS